jgi:hypothetical protein
MTYYPDFEFSSCQVAGALADAAIHDLRINHFSFPGFPQIEVTGAPDGSFTVVLIWKQTASAQFKLSQTEVKSAVEKFMAGTGHEPAIFNKVQKALLDLEGKRLDTRVYPSAHTGTRLV